MDNTTIIAIVMLACVFITMIITILKEGIDGAIKLWGVMGALTGVGFGGIVSYYFTNESNQAEIQQALQQKEAAVFAFENTVQKAIEANKLFSPLAAALKGEDIISPFLPVNKDVFLCIPESDRAVLAEKVAQAASQLKEFRKIKKQLIK